MFQHSNVSTLTFVIPHLTTLMFQHTNVSTYINVCNSSSNDLLTYYRQLMLKAVLEERRRRSPDMPVPAETSQFDVRIELRVVTRHKRRFNTSFRRSRVLGLIK